MRYVITIIAVVLGLVFLATSFVAARQFREIATSQTPVNLDDYPLLGRIGGDLMLGPANGESPRELAEKVQRRLGYIALCGLIFLLIGAAVFAFAKPKVKKDSQTNSDLDKEPSG